MRLKGLVFMILLFWSTLGAWADFQQDDLINQVREAIKAGSAKELSKFLNENVDVMIDDKLETYSKAQAEFVLRDFFKIHPVSDFNIIHKGASKGGQPYVIGLLKSGNDTYRLFMKVKKSGNSQFVHELRFSKE